MRSDPSTPPVMQRFDSTCNAFTAPAVSYQHVTHHNAKAKRTVVPLQETHLLARREIPQSYRLVRTSRHSDPVRLGEIERSDRSEMTMKSLRNDVSTARIR